MTAVKLSKDAVETATATSEISMRCSEPSQSNAGRVKHKRRKLFFPEVMLLETEFSKNNNWTHKEISEVAAKLNFSHAKVYKWHYDRVRREVPDLIQTEKL